MACFLFVVVTSCSVVVLAVVATTSEKLRWIGEVVPAHVGKDAVLDIAAEDTFLWEGNSVLPRVVTPSDREKEKDQESEKKERKKTNDDILIHLNS